MAWNKQSINFVIGTVVVLLGLTAAIAIYQSPKTAPVQSPPAQEAPAGQMPQDHPRVDSLAMQTAMEQLVAKNPQNPDYRTELANLYYDQGEYEKAAASYQESLNLRPQNPNVETDLATCYFNLGQYDKALETLNRVLKYSPGFSQALFNKGIVLSTGKKDVKGGIAVWEELLKSDPAFSQKADLEKRINQLKASIR